MGTCYVIVDAEGRNGLDIGKFYALAKVAGCPDYNDGKTHPVTVEHVREAAKGWYVRPWGGDPARWVDVEFSADLSVRVLRWIGEVTDGRPLYIVNEGDTPWGDWHEPDASWGTLWTLYVHPVYGDARPPWRLFPALAPATGGTP